MSVIRSLPPNSQRGQTLKQTFDVVKLIAPTTALLVLVLALVAFILSYSALRHLAAEHGLSGWLSYLWPLLLDGAMIVFSLAILRANFRQEKTFYPWLLTISFAALAVAGNVLEVTSLSVSSVVISAAVKALAPVALVLAFELLMSMLKNEVKRHQRVVSIDQLNETFTKLQLDLAEFERDAEVRRQELEAELVQANDRIERAKSDLAELQKSKREVKRKDKPADISDKTREVAFTILNEWKAGGVNLNRKGAQLSREMSRRLGRTVSRQVGSSLLKMYREMETDSPENVNGTQNQDTFDRIIHTLPLDESDKDALKKSADPLINGKRSA